MKVAFPTRGFSPVAVFYVYRRKEPPAGIEPAAYSLPRSRSTPEPRRRFEGIAGSRPVYLINGSDAGLAWRVPRDQDGGGVSVCSCASSLSARGIGGFTGVRETGHADAFWVG